MWVLCPCMTESQHEIIFISKLRTTPHHVFLNMIESTYPQPNFNTNYMRVAKFIINKIKILTRRETMQNIVIIRSADTYLPGRNIYKQKVCSQNKIKLSEC